MPFSRKAQYHLTYSQMQAVSSKSENAMCDTAHQNETNVRWLVIGATNMAMDNIYKRGFLAKKNIERFTKAPIAQDAFKFFFYTTLTACRGRFWMASKS